MVKSYKYTTLLLIIITIISTYSIQCARIKRISSERNFYYVLKNARLAIVMFYVKSEKEKKDSDMREQIAQLEDSFETLNTRDRYKDAELSFIKVNCVRTDLDELAHDHGIETYPSFILFDEDELVTDESGNPVILTGFVTRSQLKQFIEDNFSDHIAEILKQKDSLIKRRREEAHVTWVPYYYPYDYYYPYWDFYGRRPSYSPEIGFGYRAHIRYHPHRKDRHHRRSTR